MAENNVDLLATCPCKLLNQRVYNQSGRDVKCSGNFKVGADGTRSRERERERERQLGERQRVRQARYLTELSPKSRGKQKTDADGTGRDGDFL